MIRVILFTVSLLVLSCAKSGSKNGSGPAAPQESGEDVYLCRSENAEVLVRGCIEDPEVASNLAAEIKNWTPSLGQWTSLSFQTRHFKNKYKFSESQTQCLIKSFCKEKSI